MELGSSHWFRTDKELTRPGPFSMFPGGGALPPPPLLPPLPLLAVKNRVGSVSNFWHVPERHAPLPQSESFTGATNVARNQQPAPPQSVSSSFCRKSSSSAPSPHNEGSKHMHVAGALFRECKSQRECVCVRE